MWTRLIIISALCFVAALGATSTSNRPSPCREGQTYTKDCNTCTCAATPNKDKCSQLDCKRIAAQASTTARTPSGVRPGICPTKVTPRPGTDDCKRRDNISTCSVDKDCNGAKKCCQDGCGKFSCRNAIYNYTR